MGILDGMFRKRPLPELMSEADALFDQRKFGDAKLAYDRLEGRAEKEQPELAQRIRARSAECCDCIADARIAEAASLAGAGHLDLAREELRHAIETARGDAALARARAAQTAIEQRDAVQQASEPPPELSDEERLTLLAGSWEPLQAEELEAYGEPLSRALLALEHGQGERARAGLSALIRENPQASYLWLELARAQLICDQQADAETSLRKFLSRIGPEEGGSARIAAHRELARLCHERGEHEAAIAEFEACAEALEEDPRPLLDLGNYLRIIKRPRDAIEVLQMCGALFQDAPVEWPVMLELGLACADAGEDKRAIDALENVVETLVGRGHHDLPPPAGVALAKLHEKTGNLARAADLYGTLARGEDHAQHALYHREAARLLEQLGLSEEARRMRERAEALAPQPGPA
jgi:tetratricopeptide (TPR) repeat protein